MNPLKKRLGRERKTMAKMALSGLAMSRMADYAEVRLQKCPYGLDKPTCANCPVHCYKPGPRARARMIMRYAGPRMLLRHPYLTIRHQLDGFRKVEHPRELTRDERLKSAGR